MSISKESRLMQSNINPELIEKITLQNDIAGLTPLQKWHYVQGLCRTLGLNPATRPIQLIKFNGKEIPYFTKDSTEQLRKLNNISIHSLETKIVMDDIYIVTAFAKTPDGREDSSTGVISIKGLKGDALANALMKAETKAKRRVTLSISGLGFLDESELDTMSGYQKVVLQDVKETPPLQIEEKFPEINFDEIELDISQCVTLEDLEKVYRSAYKEIALKKDKFNLQKLIKIKNQKKLSIEKELEELRKDIIVDEFLQEYDAATGEVNEFPRKIVQDNYRRRNYGKIR